MTRAEHTPSRRWSDLQDRLLSAAVLIPVALVAIWLGGVFVALVVAAMIAGAYREWETMLTGNRHDWRGRLTTGLLALVPLGYAAAGFWTGLLLLALTLGFTLVAIDADRYYRFRLPGAAFLGLSGLVLVALRGDTTAGIWVGVFLGAATWLTDSGAFFAGRLLGGARLSPDISPSKTWTGAVGGLATGTVGGMVVWLLATDSPLWIGALLAAMVSVSGQLGDLAESAAKRRFMVKDSGDIIPGHGGILDRIDSFTVAAIGLFIIGVAHGGLDSVAQGVLYW